jgi:hypothetical protein
MGLTLDSVKYGQWYVKSFLEAKQVDGHAVGRPYLRAGLAAMVGISDVANNVKHTGRNGDDRHLQSLLGIASYS